MRPMKQDQKTNYELMRIQEAAQYLNLAKKTLYNMVSQRRIPFIKDRGPLRFDKEHLNDWLQQRTVMPMSSK